LNLLLNADLSIIAAAKNNRAKTIARVDWLKSKIDRPLAKKITGNPEDLFLIFEKKYIIEQIIRKKPKNDGSGKKEG
jgi:hypothetical protein